MVRFTRCFLCAMDSLPALRNWGGDVAITSLFLVAPSLRCCDLSLPVVPFSFVFVFHVMRWAPLG